MAKLRKTKRGNIVLKLSPKDAKALYNSINLARGRFASNDEWYRADRIEAQLSDNL